MGRRLHVVKKQAVYGNTEAFNWMYEEFRNFLKMFSDEVTGDEYSDNWEIPVEDFKKALDFVKKYAKGDDKKRTKLCEDYGIDKDDFVEALVSLDERPDGLAEIMQDFYRERDKHSSYMQFSVW